VTGVPRSWAVCVDQPKLTLPEGGSARATVTIYPSGAKGQRSSKKEQRVGFLGKVGVQARLPYADTFVPVGGVDMWVRLTERTKLTCSRQRRKDGVVVQGRLSPAVKGAVIAVEHRSGRKRQAHHLEVDKDGAYQVLVREAGRPVRGSVQAFYAGDDKHAPCDSPKRLMPQY
jgi:hypothetical protein